MKRLTAFRIALASALVSLLTSCSLFGQLSEQEEQMLKQHRAGAGKFFDSRQYAKAIDQARKGLAYEPEDERLLGQLAWSHLQLSLKDKPDNEVHLKSAEIAFKDLLELRDIDDHDPRNIFGFAIATHNWGRVEEARAERLRREAKKAPKDDRGAMLARAEEHQRVADSKDVVAKSSFLRVAEGSFAVRANRREAYKYLMALEFRHGRIDNAIELGKKCLEVNASEVKHWQREYERTTSAQREPLLRRELAALKLDELKVRSRLVAYHRKRADDPKNQANNQDYAAAVTHLDAILAANMNSSEDYYLRATCLRALGKHDDARRDYKMFLRLGKRSREHASVKDAEEYLYGKGK